LSNNEELDKIRRKRLEELKQQAAHQQIAEAQQNEYETKKYEIMRKILSVEGRQRLENIRIVKPQYAEQIELQLIQLLKTGKLGGAIPLPDKAFKNLLEQISSLGRKKEFNIKK